MLMILLIKKLVAAVENIGVDIISMAKDKININKIVEEKINELDLEELETIIISICKKEFKHIEILGLVLGSRYRTSSRFNSYFTLGICKKRYGSYNQSIAFILCYNFLKFFSSFSGFI